MVAILVVVFVYAGGGGDGKGKRVEGATVQVGEGHIIAGVNAPEPLSM